MSEVINKINKDAEGRMLGLVRPEQTFFFSLMD